MNRRSVAIFGNRGEYENHGRGKTRKSAKNGGYCQIYIPCGAVAGRTRLFDGI